MKYFYGSITLCILVMGVLSAIDAHDNKICEKYGELNNKVVEAYNGACFVKTDKGWWKL